MKKLIFVLLVGAFLCGCEEGPSTPYVPEEFKRPIHSCNISVGGGLPNTFIVGIQRPADSWEAMYWVNVDKDGVNYLQTFPVTKCGIIEDGGDAPYIVTIIDKTKEPEARWVLHVPTNTTIQKYDLTNPK